MSVANDRSVMSGAHAVEWTTLALDAPDGLAVVDAEGRFVQVNRAATVLCGRTEAELVGSPAPFQLFSDIVISDLGLLEDGSGEHVSTWQPPREAPREFAYRALPVSGRPDLTVVAFRDVTDERHRQRRVAAVARSSAKLASAGSLSATLDVLAREIVHTDALAGVQILTVDDNDGLRIMGSAGFPHWPDFFDRLLECRARGARLCMMDAYERGEPVVVPNRWQAIRKDPAWQPIHEYLRVLNWDSFASVPLTIRGHTQGVLNVYFAPGQVIGRRSMEFLHAMAEQAAVAVDYATLLQSEREHARREERQRLARDLHDSIVQQVFSISMQAKSMGVLGGRGDVVPTDAVRRIADEVGVLSRTVLTDLRAMVHELRPSSSAQLGLEEAVRALAESTENRTGLRFEVTFGPGLEDVAGDLAEDVYRIVAEAIHNVVKHADADKVVIRARVRGHRLTVGVMDDGCGIEQESSGQAETYGLTTMRERAERWGGTVQVEPRPTSGTRAQVTIPLPLPTLG
ncbi:ATP-binding protein [Phytoactinopolyspora endophytica]|uniref:sensor histidine kinase n=1 Tax=Phytoactinopolyspora endophytica TaxID=1642495 RepID=UPI00197C1FF5|nr:ATP-binding protein [Phytoactinopolyspora endophytica]